MKWHCGVCLYIYKWLGFALKSNKCLVLLRCKSKREGSQVSICCEPVDVRTSKFSLSKELSKICTGRCPFFNVPTRNERAYNAFPKTIVGEGLAPPVTRTESMQKASFVKGGVCKADGGIEKTTQPVLLPRKSKREGSLRELFLPDLMLASRHRSWSKMRTQKCRGG